MVELTKKVHTKMKPELLELTRSSLEHALLEWAYEHEGVIAQEYVSLLLANGSILEALDRVTTSMTLQKTVFSDNSACMIWAAWMNYQTSGGPGFKLTSPLVSRDSSNVSSLL